MKTTKRNKWNE